MMTDNDDESTYMPWAFEPNDLQPVLIELDLLLRTLHFLAVLNGDQEQRTDSEGKRVPLGRGL